MRIINAEEVEVKLEGELVLHDLSFQLEQGELITVMGPSGCGKTLLGKLFAGMITHHRGVFEVAEGVTAAFVEQQDNFFAESGMRHTYYSQRYEYFEGRAVPTTADLLHINAETWEDDAHLKAIIESLKVDYLLDRQLLLLSNGERKRVQLVSAIMSDADLYIFDQPFLGLDVKSREILHQKLEELKANGKTIVLVGNKRDIPTCTDRIVEMKKGTIKQITAYQAYNHEADDAFAKLDAQSLDLPLESDLQEYGDVVKLTDVNIKSLGQPLLSDINWTIRDHERWLLSGHNGSGKSTLLSMITGDNPQVYTNDVVMFGKPRGSGESVWEIKQKIGFVSPELHLYFMRQTKLTGHHFSMQHSLDCLSVVVSGLNEEIGFSSSNSIHQTNMAKRWLEALNLSYLLKKQFAEISLGEQRMLLLVRALIKNPPLLILDEPCQGVDYEYTKRFTHLLDVIAEKLNTTMIYVTHADDEIPSCITHKIELAHGKVKEMNPINN